MNNPWKLAVVLFILVSLSNATYADEWERIGPYGGTLLGVVSDPLDPDQAVVITTTPSEGSVFRTDDGGLNWTRVGPRPGSSYGIWEMSGSDTSRIYLVESGGCHYTTDGGVTWGFGAFPPDSGSGNTLCVDPVDPSTVHVAGYKGSGTSKELVYHLSTDGGQTWQTSVVGPGRPICIDVSATDPDIIYICGDRSQDGNYTAMYRTTNGGETWEDISVAVEPSGMAVLDCVAVDPTDSDRVYASSGILFRSEDGGDTWSENTAYPLKGTAIGIDPVNSANLYVAGNDLFVSTDYGLTWTERSGFSGSGSKVEVNPADPSAIYVTTIADYDYNSSIVFAPGGLFKSTDWGATWNTMVSGITAHRIDAIAVAPSQPETLFINVEASGDLNVSHDSGASVQRVTYPDVSKNDFEDLMVSSQDPDTVIALIDGIYRSTDGCTTWSKVASILGLDHIKEHPGDPDTLYASGSHLNDLFMCKSFDGGVTWPTTITIDTICYAGPTCLDVAATNPSVIYLAGTRTYVKVFRTENSGATWTDVTGNLETFHDVGDWVHALWIDPDDADHVVVSTFKGVFSTSDGGQVWNPTSVTGYVLDLCYNPMNDTLYAAHRYGGDGVYCSEDRGATWQALNTGLDTLYTQCLAVDQKNGVLYLGTTGGGAWRMPIAPQPLIKDLGEITASTGGTVNFSLDAGTENSGMYYLILGSLSGSTPGISLPGGTVLPVNWDNFTDYGLAKLNSGMFANFLGTLDGSGRASASLNLGPLAPKHIGKVMTYAYLLDWPFEFVSNPEQIVVVP